MTYEKEKLDQGKYDQRCCWAVTILFYMDDQYRHSWEGEL